MIAAAVLLVAFSAIASTDSLYFHTWKYRLHTRPKSRFEHYLHTANIVLFVPQTLLLFCYRPSGLYLILAALLTLATFLVEITDVLCERDSRADLGGLIPAEYAMHFLMAALRAGYIGVLFAQFAPSEYTVAAQLAPSPVATIGWMMVIPGSAVALFHLYLCRPLPSSTPTQEPAGIRAA